MIAKLENRFDIIKDALKDTPLNGRIAFKENAEIMDENLDVDVKEVIVSILNMFDIARYPDFNVCPTTSYGKPKTCIDYYLRYHKENAESEQQNNPFYKMRYIIKDIFQLYDRIETNMRDFYTVRNPKGRYHAMKGIVAPKKRKLSLAILPKRFALPFAQRFSLSNRRSVSRFDRRKRRRLRLETESV